MGEKPWEFTGSAGLTLSKGNNDNLTYSLQLLATYVTKDTDAYIAGDYFYGEANGLKNTENLRLHGSYANLIDDVWYWGVQGEFLTDSVADIGYRFTLMPKVGAVVWKSDQGKLNLEAGPAYIVQDQGVREDYLALYFGERFEYSFNDRLKFWQTLSFIPEAGDWGNYLLTFEAGLQATLTDHLALKFSLRDMYDSTPAPGRESNDLALIAGLTWAPGGFKAAAGGSSRRTLKPAAAAAAAPALGWTTTGALGLALNSGNAENLALTLNFDTAYRTKSDEFLGSLIGIYGEAEVLRNGKTVRERNSQSILASAQYNHLFNEVLYGGIATSLQHNDVAELNYRSTTSALLGVYFSRTERLTASVDAGPSFVFEDQAGISSTYLGLSLNQRLTWKITDTLTVGESLSYTARADDLGDSFVIATAYLDTALTDRISFRISVTNNYDNQPSNPAADKNDFLLSSGIAVKFF
jgi:Protein of unknown function, DUF481